MAGYCWRDIIVRLLISPIDYILAINQAGLIASFKTNWAPFRHSAPVLLMSFYPIAGEENNPCDRSPEDIASLSASLTGFELENNFPCRYETLEFAAGPTSWMLRPPPNLFAFSTFKCWRF